MRAPARWRSCSTTSARCNCSPPAASRTSPSRWSAGCSTATTAAAGPNGSPRSTGIARGILSEDNGAFVFALPFELQRVAPPAADLRVGATTAFNGQNYTVASNEQVALVSAQGELPRLPELGRRFPVVELRSDKGEVLSLDYDTSPPGVYLGRAVRLEDLQLTGLRDESAKDEKGRSFNCPNCGSPVTVNLVDSKSVTCPACNSIIDLSQGIGGEFGMPCRTSRCSR